MNNNSRKNVAIELSRYLFMVVLISWHGGFDFSITGI